ncbi:YdcF family protein [Sandarakinorhabdus oryzae]|uniref:YdcF family protein n=1 Tax=Sandarakinorhabdus oryzae TaxID=2675220 RepID=UPI001F22377E|nr:YdcF family protein [Sandarakinorhabdus oryzae]
MSRTTARRPTPSRPRTVRKAGPLLWLARAVAVPLLGWMLGLIWFSLTLPGPAPLSVKSDGVVVLTGGAGRFQRGLAVVEAGAARRMLISGVGRTTSRRQLAAAFGVSKRRLNSTDLGYEAVDTRSNAEETARWVAQHEFRSIRLVTSAGHMRRARLELSRVLPADVKVLSDAVPSEPKAHGLAFEYSKWLLRRGALLLGAA